MKHWKEKHAGEKPFTCKVCEKSFAHDSYLTEHMKIHSGEKPYCCDQCGLAFASDARLKLHQQKHDPEKNGLECIDCNKVLSSKKILREHRARVHGDGEQE